MIEAVDDVMVHTSGAGTDRRCWPPAGRSAYWGSSAFLLVFSVSQPFSGNRSVPEQLTLNQRVVGSSPTAPTNESIH
jgi:hypothetical protein